MITSFFAAVALMGMLAGADINSVSTPAPSAALHALATTGSGDMLAASQGGVSLHKTGGNPVTFTYSVATPWMDTAKTLLVGDEFLAPHFWTADNGDVFVMVAPHLFTGGMVVKKAGPADHFIIISGGVAKRFDYSVDVAAMM